MNDEKEKYANFGEYCVKLSDWVAEQRRAMFTQNVAAQMTLHGWMCAHRQAPSVAKEDIKPAVTREDRVRDGGSDEDMPIQGQRYCLPHPARRMAAEVIDYLLLMIVKVTLVFVLHGRLSITEIAENIDIDFRYLMNKQRLIGNDDVKMDAPPNLGQGSTNNNVRPSANPFEIITMEIVYAEILNRIFITLYEAICLSGILFSVSATPGKLLMGIRVVSCKDLFDLPASRVEVLPGSLPGFGSAFVRSVVKNFAMVFFFPLCMTALIFNHHRTTYDLIAGTIVVKVPPARQRRLNQAGWAARNPDR